MDSRPVPAQYLKAGQDYLDALVSLGLIPHYLGWGWERDSEQWLLVMVTSIIDAGGPLALNRLLFRAYNAKATPQEISPFIVRVFSPEITNMNPTMGYLGGGKNQTISRVKHADGREDKNWNPTPVQNVQQTFMGIDLELVNSYQSLPRNHRPKFMDRRKEWERFRSRVEGLAA
jgi:hypothetical protein